MLGRRFHTILVFFRKIMYPLIRLYLSSYIALKAATVTSEDTMEFKKVANNLSPDPALLLPIASKAATVTSEDTMGFKVALD